MRFPVFLPFLIGSFFLSACNSFSSQELNAGPGAGSVPEALEQGAGESQDGNEEVDYSEFHPVSLPRLLFGELSGSEFKMERVLAENEAYTRHYITYKSGDFVISGIMNVPKGDGPFPVLILNHGYIDTGVYTNGRGLKREQDYLARQGYIVIHPDYRNHAESDKDDRDELVVRLSYAQDAMNAIDALKKANLEFADTENVGMLGHSMGGGVTLASLASQPDLIDAAILYAPVSGDQSKSYERWTLRRPEAAREIQGLYGPPEESPEFWEGVSSEPFYKRIKTPVLIFHGTADADVPLEWSKETERLLKEAEVEAELIIYEGAPHEFARDWVNFMEHSAKFFDEHLKTSAR